MRALPIRAAGVICGSWRVLSEFFRPPLPILRTSAWRSATRDPGTRAGLTVRQVVVLPVPPQSLTILRQCGRQIHGAPETGIDSMQEKLAVDECSVKRPVKRAV